MEIRSQFAFGQVLNHPPCHFPGHRLLFYFSFLFYLSSATAQVNNAGNLYISGNVYVNTGFTNTATATYQNDGNFLITGDFINDQPAMAEGAGTTVFTGFSLQHISGVADPVFHHVTFNNAAGVQMNVSTVMGGTISPVMGSLFFNDHALTMGGEINPAYTNTSAFSVTPLSDLNITGPAGTGNKIYFAPSANTLHDLTLSLGGNGVLGNMLNITAGSSFGTVTADGDLDAAGFLTLRSDGGGTARVGQSAGVITGNAIVERYIPARRAWRFLTVPFSSSTQSINAAWQEGYANTTLDCPSQYPGTPGFATEITYNGINGYDVNTTNNPSIKVWLNNTWTPIESVLTPKITDYPGYCLFVRGDRSICLIQANDAIPNNTVLRATGILNQAGGVNAIIKTYNGFVGDYFFTGNPYASTINLENVINGTRVNGFDPGKIWVWDPKLGGLYGVGAYVTFSNGMWVPSGGSYPLGSGNLPVIQSGQAFMVQTNSTTATISFQEDDKIASELNVYGITASGEQYPAIFTNLLQQDSITLLDGVAAGFANRFSATIDANDAKKNWNDNENIALVRDSSTLAIEFRPVPKLADTLFFRLYLRQQPYVLKIFSANLPADIPTQAWIVDKYLGTQTAINLYDTTLYSFTPNPDTNSYRNRYMLVFNRVVEKRPVIAGDRSGQKNQHETMASVYPNPAPGGNVNLLLYGLKKGNYTIGVYTETGNLASMQTIKYEEEKTLYFIALPSAITAGSYTIRVMNSRGGSITSIPLIISGK